jgi:NAD+ diphosphatase
MHGDWSQKTYLFQGNTLVLPADIPDSLIQEGIPRETLEHVPNFSASITFFSIPSISSDMSQDLTRSQAERSRNIQSADLALDVPLPPGWRAIPMRQALSVMAGGIVVDGKGPIGRVLRAYHITQWRRESAFCGSCGNRNSNAPDGLARLCPVCGRLEYPRIAPAIIVIIINEQEDTILLAHNTNFIPGVYSLIAGFNEAGETLEATVAREIKEEVGLDVRDIHYVVSQPWPFPNSLMLGFTALYAGGTLTVDGVEIEDARWFDREHLPDLPGSGSVSRYLINRWLVGNI